MPWRKMLSNTVSTTIEIICKCDKQQGSAEKHFGRNRVRPKVIDPFPREGRNCQNSRQDQLSAVGTDHKDRRKQHQGQNLLLR